MIAPDYVRIAFFITSAFMSSTLLAQTLVKDENGFITGVDALEVDGATYNIRFETGSDGSYDSVFGSNTPTFLNNSTGARSAIEVIVGVLNSTNPPSSLSGFQAPWTEIRVPYELKELSESCYAPDNSLDAVAYTYRQNFADPAGEWFNAAPTCYRRAAASAQNQHVTFELVPAPAVATPVPAMPMYLLAVLAGLLAVAGAIRSRTTSRY